MRSHPPDTARSVLRVAVLTDEHRHRLRDLVDRDPVVNAVISARLHAAPALSARAFGGTLFGAWDADGLLVGAAFRGGNMLPIGGTPVAWSALATAMGDHPRRCSSIVGRADAVHAYWDVLGDAWGPARAIRERQPLLVADPPRLPPGDARVRAIRAEEIEAYLPAAIDMFTAELGISPLADGGAADYRRRVLGLIRAGRALGIVDADGTVAFKADLGTVSPHACQVQGVWVRPDLRGRGLGTAALAAVLRHALTLAPTVSLYVNDYNLAAMRMYRRLGMRHLTDLSTILF